jgi:hypothetical protein
VTLLLTGCKSNDVRLPATMQKSIAWLWAQQDEDGAWHSQAHAVLKDGKALTPYILYHLLQIPEDKFTRPDGGVERGIAFIRREVRASMTMNGDSLPMLNYPNYSAAYALKVLCFLQQDTALQNILAGHLLREQFIEHRGITPDDLAYGGWGYGEPGLPYGEHGHVDISHTRRIVEALTMYDSSLAGTKLLDIDGRNGGTAEGQKAGFLHKQNLPAGGELSRSHVLTLSRSHVFSYRVYSARRRIHGFTKVVSLARIFLTMADLFLLRPLWQPINVSQF